MSHEAWLIRPLIATRKGLRRSASCEKITRRISGKYVSHSIIMFLSSCLQGEIKHLFCSGHMAVLVSSPWSLFKEGATRFETFPAHMKKRH